MRIYVTGTRGIPDIKRKSGIETHCEQLYTRLAQRPNIDITVINRTMYIDDLEKKDFNGVRLINIRTIRNKHLETFVHTALSVIKAKLDNADIIHIHAIGPGLLVPLAKLLNLKVVITHHGQNYYHQKWGTISRYILKLGEYLGCKLADRTIIISKEIENIVRKKVNVESEIIPNGVNIPEKVNSNYLLKEFGLESKKYIFTLGRFVSGKGFLDLIEAYKRLSTKWKLVIAGDAIYESNYKKKLIQHSSNNIIFPGFITGEALAELFSNAGLFVLPSYYEGLPISLLEAMSYGLPIIASDIPANKQVGLKEERFFEVGNIEDLKNKLEYWQDKGITKEEKEYNMNLVKKKYSWDKIAEDTLKVYEKVLEK